MLEETRDTSSRDHPMRPPTVVAVSDSARFRVQERSGHVIRPKWALRSPFDLDPAVQQAVPSRTRLPQETRERIEDPKCRSGTSGSCRAAVVSARGRYVT